MQDIVEKLSRKWKRSIEFYVDPSLFALYAEEALTGWVLVIDEPVIRNFDNKKCVTLPLSVWILLKTLGSETVTPFRIVAKGKGLIEKAFMPHTGLKYAVRNESGSPRVHIPVEDFNSV